MVHVLLKTILAKLTRRSDRCDRNGPFKRDLDRQMIEK